VRGILNMAALTALQAQMQTTGTNPVTALRAVKSMVA
jgi:hypothetical protein